MSETRFVRIRGRIVPIKRSEKDLASKELYNAETNGYRKASMHVERAQEHAKKGGFTLPDIWGHDRKNAEKERAEMVERGKKISQLKYVMGSLSTRKLKKPEKKK